jgi:thioredoxin-like negative regulator of GroEL
VKKQFLLGLALLTACAEPATHPTKAVVVEYKQAGSPQAFAQFLRSVTPTRRVPVVYFYADWCGPCRRFRAALPSPEVDEALKQAVLIKVNIDSSQALMTHYGVTAVPTFVKVDAQGRAVATITSDAWGEDVSTKIAPVMAALVNGSAYDNGLNIIDRLELDK